VNSVASKSLRLRAGLASLLVVVMFVSGCSSIRRYLPKNPFVTPEPVGDVKKIAVLPFGYRDSEGQYPCSLCPTPAVMAETSEDDALLVTAFFYEALTRHPRFEVVPYETVQRLEGKTMRETMDRLEVMTNVHAVLTGALLELRPRVGDPANPEQRGGAAYYVVLIDANTGEELWNRVFDKTQRPQNIASAGWQKLVSSKTTHWQTSLSIAQKGAVDLMNNMARTVR
jgi:hypothetical protein